MTAAGAFQPTPRARNSDVVSLKRLWIIDSGRVYVAQTPAVHLRLCVYSDLQTADRSETQRLSTAGAGGDVTAETLTTS